MSRYAEALAAVPGWPVGIAAAAVVDRSGVRATVGDPSQPFALASVTKPLAALAALVAVEEEAVGLDDPVAMDVVDGATIRHLFSHASGLAMDRRVRGAEPGTRRIYSNAGIDLLAELVSDATGIAFAEYFREAVGQPLQLTATTLGEHPSRDGTSTVADLARVLAELLAPTGLLAAPTLAELRTVQFPGLRGVVPGFGMQTDCDWGLGFELRDHKSPHWTGRTNSPATYGHFGQAGTMLWIDPEPQIGLVALTDEPFGDWARAAWPALSDAVVAAA
jgi:CubicO group peptidase (beta-lactamase class C family)